MKHFGDRVVDLAKAALIGYLTVFAVTLLALLVVFLAILAVGPSSLSLAVGPLPLASTWHSASGYGFETQWGLPLISVLGAVAGIGLVLRRQMIRAA